MNQYHNVFTYFFRFFISGIALVTGIILLLFVATYNANANDLSVSNETKTSSLTKSPSNVLSSGTSEVFSDVNYLFGGLGDGITSAISGFASTTSNVGQNTLSGIWSGISFIGSGIGSAANGVGNGIVAILSAPANFFGSISESSFASGILRPNEDQIVVPIIDPNSPELLAAIETFPSENQPNTNNQGPQWPLNGRVTADFGVPHWPFQPVHTGIDISSGNPSGVSPIKPFRPGKVVDTVVSGYGYGNHVVVDHGNGLTSLYSHFSSISVSEGQDVSLNTLLGYEGSTGLSTGPHLHFEVRVNGYATNPGQFISGRP